MARIDVYAAQSRDFYRSRSIRIAGVILLCLTAIAAYFVFAAPVHQLYWGIRARMNPMLDENDFKRLGKQWVTVEGECSWLGNQALFVFCALSTTPSFHRPMQVTRKW